MREVVVIERDGPMGAASAAPALSAARLSRAYGELIALREVSFDLARGETLCVLGPNGAGKTTLLRILATLLRPSSGQVSVLGAELPRHAWKARGRIGLLGHEPLLYRDLTVAENLAFHARLHRVGDAAARVDELLGAVRLDRRGNELVRNLSVGMAQRAAICRAVLHRPELLLLDEPRSHLDPEAAAMVEPLIGRESGLTRVLVSHDAEAALAESDRALVLASGGNVAYEGASSGVAPGDARAAYGGRP
ncbi:MAG: ABC transporter ATP-binding protein [Solirubrobacterales bacterium]